jgi:autotransporter passenger strand-loop-strand repeat protein
MSMTRAVSSNREIRAIHGHASPYSEIAFIDPGVSDIPTLLAGLRAEVEPILLDAGMPALTQIAAELRGRFELDAIHIIAHGAPGEVSFSAGRLSIESIHAQAAELAAIGKTLSHDGELRLWSCRTGAHETGKRFIGALERASGAAVAAAAGMVGSAARGGRWELDARRMDGAQAPLTADGRAAYAGVLTTYTWNGNHGNSWTSSNNWSPNGTPGTNDSVIIPAGSSGPLIQGGFFSNVSYTIATLTVDSGATITVDDSTGFGASSASLTVNSGITLAGGTLAGSGTITNNGTLTGYGTVSVTTLGGSGAVIASGGTLDLTGTVSTHDFSINSATASTLEFQGTATVSASTLGTLGTNQTLEVAAGGALTISGAETIGNGGTLLLAGGTLTDASGVTIASGGTLILSGGTPTDVTLQAGATEVVASGATATTFSIASGVTAKVYGTAISATVDAGGSQIVESGGHASGTVVLSGGSELVSSGGVTSAAAVFGTETVYGSAIDDLVQAGIQSGGIQITGIQTVESGGYASGTKIVAGGEEVVSSGGHTIADGVSGTLLVYGSAVSALVSAGGFEVIYGGGVASGTTVSSGGTIVLSGGTDPNVTLLSGATEEVGSGSTLSGAGIGAGVSLVLLSGGAASGTTVSSGGTIVLSGGTVEGTLTLSSGATEVVGRSQSVNGITVSNGVTVETVYYGVSGGVVSGATVLSGGSVVVSGFAYADTVSKGGSQTIALDGVASGTIVSSGGTQTIQSLGQATGTIVQSGGTEVVSAGGTTTSASVSGTETVYGSALSDTVNQGGSQTIATGGVASGTIVLSGGTEIVQAGGVASGGTVAGTVTVSGAATGMSINSGGIETAATGGSISGITVNSGGELVMSGGTASGVTLNQGASVDLATVAYATGDKAVVITSNGVERLVLETSAGTPVTNGSSVILSGSYTGAVFTVTTDGHGDALISEPVCYLRGTRILTQSGERSIEELKIGDRVVTRFGGLRPIKWIGRSSYLADDVRHDRESIPVHIRTGALGDGLPARDLYISPGHSMLLGGTLVLAKSLVNGITVTQDWLPSTLDYFQVELDTHDCVRAEGAWSETFADGPGLREKFHNLAEFYALFPDHRTPQALVALCAPRPERGPALAEALQPIVERAGARIAPGPLRGFIDRVDGLWKLDGWAQDAVHPDLPVLLEVLIADEVIGTVLACDFRPDLFDVFGHGNSSFVFESPVKLRPELLRTLQVRRASDGAAVPINEHIRPRAEVPADDQTEGESAGSPLSLVAAAAARSGVPASRESASRILTG